MKIVRGAFIFGLSFWAIGTAVLVPFGHKLFGPDNIAPVALSSAIVIALTFVAVRRIGGRILRQNGGSDLTDGALLGVVTCTPGLALDGMVYAFNGGRYPGLDAPASGAMSATLLLTYAAALLAASTAAPRRPGSSARAATAQARRRANMPTDIPARS